MARMVHEVKQRLPPGVRSFTTSVWRRTLGRQYPRRSWSQGGEDLVLLELLRDSPWRAYVDVGAFHPKWGSNTYALYRRGWSGINIDARPGSMAAFRRARPRDVNLEIGVAGMRTTLQFHVFADDELSTFDTELARHRLANHRLLGVESVEVWPLCDIIQQHRPNGIDVLSVDVEGLDLEVLGSNDWGRFRPSLVVVEEMGRHPSRFDSSPVARFMAEVDYEIVAATGMNLFFAPRTASTPSHRP